MLSKCASLGAILAPFDGTYQTWQTGSDRAVDDNEPGMAADVDYECSRYQERGGAAAVYGDGHAVNAAPAFFQTLDTYLLGSARSMSVYESQSLAFCGPSGRERCSLSNTPEA